MVMVADGCEYGGGLRGVDGEVLVVGRKEVGKEGW
jgi:hypothetical protein